MSSVMRALEPGQVLNGIETRKPNRAEVGHAFRTIIRWTWAFRHTLIAYEDYRMLVPIRPRSR
jgi:hypothetical protein